MLLKDSGAAVVGESLDVEHFNFVVFDYYVAFRGSGRLVQASPSYLQSLLSRISLCVAALVCNSSHFSFSHDFGFFLIFLDFLGFVIVIHGCRVVDHVGNFSVIVVFGVFSDVGVVFL